MSGPKSVGGWQKKLEQSVRAKLADGNIADRRGGKELVHLVEEKAMKKKEKRGN